ncbi:aromatic ring-hydroxylating dioxygenase subunit alpha [Sphingobium sp. DC-2]|uniref:aromatic ring-hydroxylating dioxygenase subunit alpha n=1 Tax=Sphingobium sp. DC-2 TaxID=1303256 RepID=UPI0004C44D01|nr:aromatic ring-hydroxylating dioxygenase subunit alpha [Sphingobium sp. DC-2]
MDDASALSPDPIRPGIGTSGTARNWPLNSWWVAAHGSEVSEKPIMRWIMELPIALYRTESQEAVALHNRCPHRWAPLHMGEVAGDRLICPYHGMEFEPSGQCMKVPTQDNTPSAIRIRAFPVEERYGFIWIWMGEASLADPELIPADLAYLEDPAWYNVWGYKAVNANFMQIKENVLDLTHFSFLHKNSLGVTDWNRPPKVESANGRVTYSQFFENSPLAAIYAAAANKTPGKIVNRETWGTQLSPGAHHSAVNIYDLDTEPNGLSECFARVVHLTTPVSVGKTHYYWVMARDHGGPYDVEQTRAFIGKVFAEDVTMLEATQDMARRAADQDEALEFSVSADRAGVTGRRLVAAMTDAEKMQQE